MSDYTRKEGSTDTRDVVAQAATGLPYITGSCETVEGRLTTEKVDDGVGGSWKRVSLEPVEVEEPTDVFFAPFGDYKIYKAIGAGGTIRLKQVIDKAEAASARFSPYNIPEAVPRDGQHDPDYRIMAGGLVARLYTADSVGSTEPTGEVQIVGADSRKSKTIYRFYSWELHYSFGFTPDSYLFGAFSPGHGVGNKAVFMFAYAPQRIVLHGPQGSPWVPAYALYADAPRIVRFVGRKQTPEVWVLPGTGNTDPGTFPTAQATPTRYYNVDVSDSYIAPLVVPVTKDRLVAIVFRAWGNITGILESYPGPRVKYSFDPIPDPVIYWNEDQGVLWQERPAPEPWALAENHYTEFTNGFDRLTLTQTFNGHAHAVRETTMGVPWTKDSALFLSRFVRRPTLAVGGRFQLFTVGRHVSLSLGYLDMVGLQARFTGVCRPKGAAVFSYVARAPVERPTLSDYSQEPRFTGETYWTALRDLQDQYITMVVAGVPQYTARLVVHDESNGYLDACGIVVVNEDGSHVRRPFPWPRLNSGVDPKVFCTDNEGEEIGTIAYDFDAGGWRLYTSTDLGQKWKPRAIVTRTSPPPRFVTLSVNVPPSQRRVGYGVLTLSAANAEFAPPNAILPARIGEQDGRAYPGAPWLYE